MNLQPMGGVGHQPAGNCRVSARCPVCGDRGTLDEISNIQDGHFAVNQKVYVTGQRLCPNRTCRTQLFFVYDTATKTVAALYPPELIDFDATNIPAMVTRAMKEAIACHSMECYIAAAIMVRKTLEELCHEQGAKGGNLKGRIKDLGTKIVLPADLLNGLDDLRLLGNDAAHIESREFNTVGKEEVEIGIELAKEVLKATYQYSELLKKLRGLKKNP